MSVAFGFPLVSTGYAFACNLDEAKQECQANAVGALRWVEEKFDVWEATDPVTYATYEINALAY